MVSNNNNKHTSSVLNLHGNLPSATLKLIRDAQEWGRAELEPHIAVHWEQGTFPTQVWDSFKVHCPRLLGYNLPREYGGQGYDKVTQGHITKTLASIDASFTTSLLVHLSLCAESIWLCGASEAQKQRFLPSLARHETLGCFCLTEPQSGSDASDLRTTATRTKDGSYRLHGTKRWIGNALTAEIMVVWARNMSLADRPVMGFVLQRSQQPSAHNIQTSKIHGKTSLRMTQNANVEFRDAVCPAENVLGGSVGFAESVGRVLESSRVGVAWFPVGICMGAIDKTMDYICNRTAFGAPLSSNQLIQEKLARMTAMVSSMYLLVERVTMEFAQNKCDVAAISMVKAYNSRLGREIVATCRDVMGGNGIVLEYGLASKFCDMEAVYTYEGTYDVCMLVAGRALTGISAIKSSSGGGTKGKKTKNEKKDGQSLQQRSKL